MEHLIDGEVEMIRRYIKPGMVVVDVGAFDGDWSRAVLSQCPDVVIHAFEPVPATYAQLLERMKEPIAAGRLIPNPAALSDGSGAVGICMYPNLPALSSIHRRNEEDMERVQAGEPEVLQVQMMRLRDYCQQKGIEQIGFLKIDTEGHECSVLRGCSQMIWAGRIDCVQFEYGGCYPDAGTTLEEAFSLLTPYDYRIGKACSGDMVFHDRFSPEMETYEYCNYLAVR